MKKPNPTQLRIAATELRDLLSRRTSERDWQLFFSANPALGRLTQSLSNIVVASPPENTRAGLIVGLDGTPIRQSSPAAPVFLPAP